MDYAIWCQNGTPMSQSTLLLVINAWFLTGFASGPRFYIEHQVVIQNYTSIVLLTKINKTSLNKTLKYWWLRISGYYSKYYTKIS